MAEAMTHPAEAIYQACDQWASPLKEVLYESVMSLNAQVVVEIGTNIGDSARIFSTALRHTGGHLWTLDTQGANCTGIAGNWVESWDCSNITFLVGDSATYPWEPPIDLLLIDGAHEYPAVSTDLAVWWPRVREGGRMLVHDVTLMDDVHRAWREWVTRERRVCTYYPHGVGLAVINK